MAEKGTESKPPKPIGVRVLHSLGRIAVLLLIGMVGLYVAFYFVQPSLIFSPSIHLRGDPSDFGWAFEDVYRDVPGGTTHGWYVPAPHARGVVLYSHGNDSNISDYLGSIRMFRSLGFSMLIYDYGGFGNSTGKPSEKRVYADAMAMWDYLTEEKGIAPETIVLYGPSFGGGPTCELATHVDPAGVVLENTFSSMADAAFKHYPWLPGEIFIHHKFKNKKKVREIDAPILIIHSQGDTLYPYAQGQLLYELANEPKQFLEVYGDHGEGSMVSRDIFIEGLEKFLSSEDVGLGRSMDS